MASVDLDDVIILLMKIITLNFYSCFSNSIIDISKKRFSGKGYRRSSDKSTLKPLYNKNIN